MTRQGESLLKRQMKDLLNERGAFWSSIQGGPGSKPGDPDMVACYRGRYVAIEAKTPGGRQRYEQKDRQREIEAAGGIYILAYDLDTIANILDTIDKEMEE